MTPRRIMGICLLLMANLLPMSLPLNAQTVSDEEPAKQEASEDILPLNDLRVFTLIFDQIRRAYVEPISDKTLLENAVKGMLQELDPHSAYLDTRQFTALQESTQGEFSGVGLEIGTDNGYIKVVTPIDGTPAYEAGMQSGDIIIEVNGESIRGFSVSETAQKMRGPIGTDVTLTVLRQGEAEPFEVTITRGTIKLSSLRSRLIEDRFGYIRIAQFQANTGKEFSNALKKLLADKPDLSGIVLDLRNNPGGILQASVKVVDALIEDGLIVYTEGRIENSKQSFSATPGDITNGLPVVVLINGGSASAAEIVAGALQDSQRAVIMGTQSFGKGSVQTILPIDDERGIKLTTALYFTPSGRSIQAQGIEPDIIVERATITQLEERPRIRESDLSGHLETDKTQPNRLSDEAVEDSKKITEDNQLFEAINLLKGLAIFHQAQR